MPQCATQHVFGIKLCRRHDSPKSVLDTHGMAGGLRSSRGEQPLLIGFCSVYIAGEKRGKVLSNRLLPGGCLGRGDVNDAAAQIDMLKLD
jgi:hypothetical protein